MSPENDPPDVGYDDKDADAAEVEDEYKPDPDAAPTVEGRIEQSRVELKKLLTSALVAAGAIGCVLAATDTFFGHGYDNTYGFFVGAALATVNLWLLAGGYFQVVRGERTARAVVAFLSSFLALVIVTGWVVLAHKEWTLGFAFGLTLPAAAGLVYARTLK